MNEWQREDETLHDLQCGGLRILQKRGGFRFGTDAVLLADFAAARPGERIADFGTGTGILPLLMAARSERTRFEALEIQPDIAEMAQRSVRLNALDGRPCTARMCAMPLPFWGANRSIGWCAIRRIRVKRAAWKAR